MVRLEGDEIGVRWGAGIDVAPHVTKIPGLWRISEFFPKSNE